MHHIALPTVHLSTSNPHGNLFLADYLLALVVDVEVEVEQPALPVRFSSRLPYSYLA